MLSRQYFKTVADAGHKDGIVSCFGFFHGR
jgi:hypothetical protein